MTSIYLPLRSNAAWFASATHREQLDRRLKNLVMVHDTVTLQNGRYRRAVSETGAFDVMSPADQIENRELLQFVEPGTPFSVSVSRTGESDWHQVIGGDALVNYDVDFFPLMYAAGLVQAPFIVWSDGDISSNGKSRAQLLASSDKQSESVRAALPDGRYLQDGIIDGLYIDSLIGHAHSLPISVDFHTASLIEHGNSRVARLLEPEPLSAIV